MSFKNSMKTLEMFLIKNTLSPSERDALLSDLIAVYIKEESKGSDLMNSLLSKNMLHFKAILEVMNREVMNRFGKEIHEQIAP